MSIETPEVTFTHPASIDPHDAILVIGAAIFTTLLTEGLS